ncbi:MAG: polysaccharide pyruvyl transferase family protein [Actinomycetes bacterium]
MPQPVRIAIIGAALSANKGAAAMVESVMARLPNELGECHFDILTTYPEADSSRVPAGADASVVGLQPLRLALIEFPIACLALLARSLRLPLFWVRSRGCRSMLDAEVVVDVAGISFADGRGFAIVVYNSLMTGVPLLLGVPTVKAAQALGPFQSFPNKWLAPLVLRRVRTVCARGARTREHLDSLGGVNAIDVADLAFSLDEAGSFPEAVNLALGTIDKDFIVVMPSAVVRGIYESTGGNYVAAMASLVADIRAKTGRSVVIAPHSYRAGLPEGRMNDGPVCREVFAACSGDSQVLGLDFDLTAGELRHLVAQSSVLVTSRFHAMISGLSTATPTVVIGWSHKYKEVLDDFGLASLGLDSSALDQPNEVADIVARVLASKDAMSQQISAALPAVKERSLRNFSAIAEAARR